ncbi:ef-hand calcium-binding domain-containing protein 6 [Limosa lapponica baueri]|uniref:Ef-hand calcium-binding domain-containing protein 6 n=1 Tax=Limosa lapponica baueri TaxID=1758121 RepID=A0A2I0U254_LIMLA|nr:ef-hand calcium-binding domain-containing protein 6 [Limosa lapponica baueri]
MKSTHMVAVKAAMQPSASLHSRTMNNPVVVEEKLVKELDYVGEMVGSLKVEGAVRNRKIKRQVTEIVLTSNGAKYMFDRHSPIQDIFSLGISIRDSKLSCLDFLRAIDDGRASKYQQRQKQTAPPASFAALSLEQALIKIKEIVASSYDLLHKTEEGQKVIPPKSSWELSERGILSQEFWDVCSRHQWLTEEQFENLWNTVNFSAGGRLKYDLLKKISSEVVMVPSWTLGVTSSATSTKPAAHTMQDPRVSSQPERPKTSSSLVGQKSIQASSHPQTTCSASTLNCETIENKIRKIIQHSWRDILKVYKEKDVSKLGEIPVSDFLDIAEKFNLDLSEGEINQITTKYDLKKNGRFAYYDFLQSCILLLKPQERSLLQRVIIRKPPKPLSPGPQTTSYFSSMLRIQPQILRCWKPMKRTFKSYDESHTGLLHIADFRQVLQEYGINLTEEELFNILEYYDKNLSSKISYNDFLRAFIQ